LLPWSLLLWRWRAREFSNKWKNELLLSFLRTEVRVPVYVATFGFCCIVRPLLRHMDLDAKLCVAGSFLTGYKARREGKNNIMTQRLGAEVVSNSVVITDSAIDFDILNACGAALLIRWPEAKFIGAFSNSYVPFLYTQRAKRPGGNYMLYGVMMEDIVILCIALCWKMPHPLVGAAALAVLHLSFWAIYEIGYFENDTIAARREVRPKLGGGADRYFSRMKPRTAWLAALGIAVLPVVSLVYFNDSAIRASDDIEFTKMFPVLYGEWVAYLLVSRALFWLYNRMVVSLRAYFYVILQLVRTLGYAIVFKCGMVGAALLLALVFARWQPYLTYRYGGRYLPVSYRPLALFSFLILAAGGMVVDAEAFFGFQFLVGCLWFGALAYRPLLASLREVYNGGGR
jgi:hypothetical protein